MTRKQLDMDVVTAAKKRLKNVFSNGVPVTMSFSGGKDSLCLAGLVEELARAGEIDITLLTVVFIDEEAIFPCIEETVKKWRLRFMALGARFLWFALEVKHYSCLNMLENDESFICFDHTKRDVWVREPPPFAIRKHPCHRGSSETYQQFLSRFQKGTITITGVRVAESVQRLKNIAHKKSNLNKLEPIYDWKDSDVWLYLRNRPDIELPEIYLFLFQTGKPVNKLRVSQFFSIDTVSSLVNMNEYYPDLMERINRREPNAYLVALYWDSEMFGRSTRTRRELEDNRDYRKLCYDLLKNPGDLVDTPHNKKMFDNYRKQFMKWSWCFTDKMFKTFYEGLYIGDPKERKLRALLNSVAIEGAKKR